LAINAKNVLQVLFPVLKEQLNVKRATTKIILNQKKELLHVSQYLYVEQQVIANTLKLPIPIANVQQIKDYYVREVYLMMADFADGAAERVSTRQEAVALHYHPMPYLILQETVGNVSQVTIPRRVGANAASRQTIISMKIQVKQNVLFKSNVIVQRLCKKVSLKTKKARIIAAKNARKLY